MTSFWWKTSIRTNSFNPSMFCSRSHLFVCLPSFPILMVTTSPSYIFFSINTQPLGPTTDILTCLTRNCTLEHCKNPFLFFHYEFCFSHMSGVPSHGNWMGPSYACLFTGHFEHSVLRCKSATKKQQQQKQEKKATTTKSPPKASALDLWNMHRWWPAMTQFQGATMRFWNSPTSWWPQ